MRKLATKVAIVAAFAAVAGYGVYANQKEEVTLSDTALANIEALARGELPEVGISCSYNKGRCWARRGPLCMKGEYTGPACIRTGNTSDYCTEC